MDAAPGDGPDVDYARAKRGGELAAAESFGDHALLVRAGLILGPYENIGRLPWWLNRIARGGPVLAPGPRDLPLQYIDVRDLAAWLLDAAHSGLGGAYNLVSPPGHTTTGELLGACAAVTGSGAELRWTEPEKVLAAGIEPWSELPVWLPRASSTTRSTPATSPAPWPPACAAAPSPRRSPTPGHGCAPWAARPPAPRPPHGRPRPGEGGRGARRLRPTRPGHRVRGGSGRGISTLALLVPCSVRGGPWRACAPRPPCGTGSSAGQSGAGQSGAETTRTSLRRVSSAAVSPRSRSQGPAPPWAVWRVARKRRITRGSEAMKACSTAGRSR